MAHELVFSNDQVNIAVVGDAPWHSLGQTLQPGDSIEAWAQAAGLSHNVNRAVVEYTDNYGEQNLFADREVLYRSDTLKPLGVVGRNYHVVQPAQVLDFFAQLAQNNHFQLETAGALSGGRRIWALAKVSDGAPVIGQDVVKPYVLLATSYDGSLSTTARFTTVRVVCSNTLGFATTEAGDTIKVPHNREFVAEDTRLDLGIAFGGFDRFLIEARKLASKQINTAFAVEFLKQLLPPGSSSTTVNGVKTVTPIPVEDGKAFKDILALFQGEATGGDMPEARGTAWGLLNATTQYVDHISGRNPERRMQSAWFGNGNLIKNAARDLLLEVVA